MFLKHVPLDFCLEPNFCQNLSEKTTVLSEDGWKHNVLVFDIHRGYPSVFVFFASINSVLVNGKFNFHCNLEHRKKMIWFHLRPNYWFEASDFFSFFWFLVVLILCLHFKESFLRKPKQYVLWQWKNVANYKSTGFNVSSLLQWAEPILLISLLTADARGGAV